MPRRIRIIQLVTGLSIGDEMGGAELFGVQLARRLDPQRYEVAVCALWHYGSDSEKRWLEQLRSEGYAVYLLGDPTRPLYPEFAHVVRVFGTIVRDFEADIINSHGERVDVLNLIAHFLYPERPRAVRTMHTDVQWQKTPWLGAALNLCLFPWAFAAEVAISISARQALDRRPLARLLRRNHPVIYNGIDAGLLRYAPSGASALQDLGLRSHGLPVIGIVGRLTEQKGHRYFLEAAVQVLQFMPAVFVVVGSGPLEESLRHMASSLGLHASLHFLGSRSDVPELMCQLDLLVSASLWEGLPTVLLEAMALHVPVVATDVSGSREIVRPGDTGWLVPPADSSALALAILESLRARSEAHRMAANAYQIVGQYTIQASAAAYGKLYASLAP